MSPTSILITGANQGLGYEAAVQLSVRSDLVLILGGRTEAKIREAAEKLSADPATKAKIDYVVIDLTKDESIFAAVKQVEEKLGGRGLDVLLNNAAINRDFPEPTLQQWRDVLRETYETNVFGTLIATEAFLPLLQKGVEPRIINVGSGLGSQTNQLSDAAIYHHYAYNSSKAALNSITVTEAVKYKNIHIVVIDPGYTATAINGYSGGQQPAEAVKVYVEHVLKRTGKSGGYYDNHGELPW